VSAGRAADPLASAAAAGLRYVNDTTLPGIRRIGHKTRVRYVGPNGRTIADETVLRRIKSLVIPPAWTDVWICPLPLGHLQATGRDARGRKQYRYHPKWRQVRDEVKYGQLLAFSSALPKIRAATSRDLGRTGLPREKVLGAVVQLLEKTLIRVGNEEYARTNHSFGLTTLRDQHARVNGSGVEFTFRGKSGVAHRVTMNDARLARVVKSCRDLPGQDLFQYLDAEGQRQAIESADVNGYLKEVSGADFTAKDFRTWAGTVMMARALAALERATSKGAAQRQIARAVKDVAAVLGNTAAVCRKCYIHPAVIDAYVQGKTIRATSTRKRAVSRATLSAEERAVVSLLRQHAA
jgi:DNA topoisomerase I